MAELPMTKKPLKRRPGSGLLVRAMEEGVGVTKESAKSTTATAETTPATPHATANTMEAAPVAEERQRLTLSSSPSSKKTANVPPPELHLLKRMSLVEIVTSDPTPAAEMPDDGAASPPTPPSDVVSQPPMPSSPEKRDEKEESDDASAPEEVTSTQPQNRNDDFRPPAVPPASPPLPLSLPLWNDERKDERRDDEGRRDDEEDRKDDEERRDDVERNNDEARNNDEIRSETTASALDLAESLDLEGDAAEEFLSATSSSLEAGERMKNIFRVLDELEMQPFERSGLHSPPPQYALFPEEQQIVTQDEIPDLFSHSINVPTYAEIAALRSRLHGAPDDDAGDHLAAFEQDVDKNLLLIRSAEELRAEALQYKEDRVVRVAKEADLVNKRQQLLLLQEAAAAKRLDAESKRKLAKIAWEKSSLRHRDRLHMELLHNAFKRAESQLVWALNKRKAEVQTMFGDLTLADGQYGGAKGRRWKIEWERTPQPVQIKLKCLRGVRDKLPRGRYVVMVSMYNRLGGNVLRWSNLKGQQWSGATLPVPHGGRFYDVEIKLNQSVFTVCPSRPDVRPGMILTFEVFLLRGNVVNTDRVVAWGVFPISNSDFNIIEGKYKSPLLRGELDPRVEKHRKLEEMINEDVDNWLCNLYFEVIKLPRYLGGQKEFEVELSFTSSLLGHPDRLLGAEESRDGEEPEVGVESTLSDVVPSTVASSVPITAASTPPLLIKGIKSSENHRRRRKKAILTDGEKGKRSSSSSRLSRGVWSSSSSSSSSEDGADDDDDDDDDRHFVDVSDGGKKKKSVKRRIVEGLKSATKRNRNKVDVVRRGNDVGGNPFPTRPMTTIGSRSAIGGVRVPTLKQLREETDEEDEEEDRNGIGEDGDDDDSSIAVMESPPKLRSEDDGDKGGLRRVEKYDRKDDGSGDDHDDDGFVPVRGQPGMYYKRHLLNPVDVYQKKMHALLPKTAMLMKKHPIQRHLRHAEQLQQHTFVVKPPFCEKQSIGEPAWERASYARRQLLSELGLAQWRTPDFWAMILMFLFTFLLRVVFHYGGQFLILMAMKKPYNMFEIRGYDVALNFPATSLNYTREVVLVTLAGPLIVIFTFCLLLLFSYAMQKLLGIFPNILSKFVLAFGLQSAMDPILILLIDATMPSRFTNENVDVPLADAAKLWWHFARTEGSGLYGVFITLFLYTFTCLFGSILVYVYFLRLHNNGRLMDVYHRLTGDEGDFFLPFDLELSLQELSYVCRRSEQWRGEEGERRKVTVYEYTWNEYDATHDVTRREDLETSIRTRRKQGRNVDVTTHVSIHTLHLDGFRELYRQFLRMPDGAIVEVLNTDLPIPGLHEDVKRILRTENERIKSARGSPRPNPGEGAGAQDVSGASLTVDISNLRLRTHRPSVSSNG